LLPKDNSKPSTLYHVAVMKPQTYGKKRQQHYYEAHNSSYNSIAKTEAF